MTRCRTTMSAEIPDAPFEIPEAALEAAVTAYIENVGHKPTRGAIEAAILAYEAAIWIDSPTSGPLTDGRTVVVYAGAYAGLPAFQCTAAYHPRYGWCVDELRQVVKVRQLPAPPRTEP